MIVTVLGASGLTKAYVSVESATGSLEISGASRCDDMTTSSPGLGGVGGAHHTRDELLVLHDDLLGALHDRDVAGGSVTNMEDDRAVAERLELLWLQLGL